MAVALNKTPYDVAKGRWYEAEVLAAPHRNFMYDSLCFRDFYLTK